MLALTPYDGTGLRARFRSRLLLRRALAAVGSLVAAEVGYATLRLPLGGAVARKVFFGAGVDSGRGGAGDRGGGGSMSSAA